MKTATELFKEARDFLITHRTDYETAYRDYRRPQLDKFNWALDWFDVLAKNNSQTALWIVRNHNDQWLDQKISYQELSSRSSKVARYFQKLGMKRGDAILIMLPNVLPLWETILAVMKLGGIVVPTSTGHGSRSSRPCATGKYQVHPY